MPRAQRTSNEYPRTMMAAVVAVEAQRRRRKKTHIVIASALKIVFAYPIWIVAHYTILSDTANRIAINASAHGLLVCWLWKRCRRCKIRFQKKWLVWFAIFTMPNLTPHNWKLVQKSASHPLSDVANTERLLIAVEGERQRLGDLRTHLGFWGRFLSFFYPVFKIFFF